MSFENLNQNIRQEREILDEIILFSHQAMKTSGKDLEILEKTISSLIELMKILNNSIPELSENVSIFKGIDGTKKEIKGLTHLQFQDAGIVKSVVINEADRKRFMIELNLSRESMKRLKNVNRQEQVVIGKFKKPSVYAKVANFFFFGLSTRLVDKGYFKPTAVDMRKANMPFIINTYISMAFFTSMLFAIFSTGLFILLLFYNIGIDSPFLTPLKKIALENVLRNLVICAAIPVFLFFFFVYYPSLEKKAVAKKINNEIPFVAIHMSAVAGSGIEPTKIFAIIAMSKDYPATGMEIRKVINQVNIYGYDLINALKNSARNTSSERLAELFNGLATTISGGGNLTDFFEKRAESLLFDYKLERERATKVAETFMDIYISVVIAAPMIMMLLLVLMSVTGLGLNLSLPALTFVIVSVVALINVVFMFILHMRQSDY